MSDDDWTADLEELYRQHHLRFVRLAFLLTSQSGVAEEIVQDAFLKTWAAWRHLRNPKSAEAYIRQTVVNLARSNWRRRVLELRHLSRREESTLEVDSDTRVEMIQALRRLPPRQRACVVLRYYEGLSEHETAKVLSISVGTVKSQTHKALQQLKRNLGGWEGEEIGS